ncbi:SDR family NAD(P)-dependent oxidoreductase [Nocardia sp. CDC159]|uniref:SDR family NAD(P)-dependent oxidoreductase n=1 Tax=Nocardia pulmonis TaxID=2951408 RepID=A0A9X2IUW6_9NOCA|nr:MULTISPECIES: SDR family NAD(P)-dependent oxidoreductase [Nocardia]MCM6772583.1 SDR family NAD(P)-dependent oxidoreductase [Nocardia pulmonis]MCM6784759.1 SDR family NAD(P)-dependent oxidoreductase [Nocardia sp. CDC159]
MADKRKAIVITGCSSGIGRECAVHLADHGFIVYAGIRSDQAADELRRVLPGDRLRPVPIDVTSEQSITNVYKLVSDELAGGGLLGLVNNAGISVSAPLECVPREEMRNQLEVNLIGTASMVRQFLPLLRAGAGTGGPAGRIVNITSGIGRLALPYLSAYAASQFGKEGLSDALRRELAPFGIGVSVIQPPAIPTPIWEKQAAMADRLFDNAPEAIAALYRDRYAAFAKANDASAAASPNTPGDVARAVEHALTARRPRTRYRIGKEIALIALATRLLPDRMLDRSVAKNLDLES